MLPDSAQANNFVVLSNLPVGKIEGPGIFTEQQNCEVFFPKFAISSSVGNVYSQCFRSLQ